MADVLHIVVNAAIVAGLAMIVMAALHDVLARTVPNGLALSIAGAGLLAQIGVAAGAADVRIGLLSIAYALVAAILVFVAAALMWRQRWMGGGDVKLLGAAALLMPAGLVPMLVVATSLSGGVLSVIYLSTRHRLSPPGPMRAHSLVGRAIRAERWRLRRGGPLPYAVAIAGGACFVIVHGSLS